MVLRFVIGTKARLGLLRLRAEEDLGATAVEYAIMLALIAAVIVAAVAFLGQSTDAGFRKVTFPP
jgi:pilus assembly protein Flp/PilA